MKLRRGSSSNPMFVESLICYVHAGFGLAGVPGTLTTINLRCGMELIRTALQDTLLEALVKREDVNMLTAVSNNAGSGDSGLGAFHFVGLFQ